MTAIVNHLSALQIIASIAQQRHLSSDQVRSGSRNGRITFARGEAVFAVHEAYPHLSQRALSRIFRCGRDAVRNVLTRPRKPAAQFVKNPSDSTSKKNHSNSLPWPPVTTTEIAYVQNSFAEPANVDC